MVKKNVKKELKKFENYLKIILNAIIISDSKSVVINGHTITFNGESFVIKNEKGESLSTSDTTLFFMGAAGVSL